MALEVRRAASGSDGRVEKAHCALGWQVEPCATAKKYWVYWNESCSTLERCHVFGENHIAALRRLNAKVWHQDIPGLDPEPSASLQYT